MAETVAHSFRHNYFRTSPKRGNCAAQPVRPDASADGNTRTAMATEYIYEDGRLRRSEDILLKDPCQLEQLGYTPSDRLGPVGSELIQVYQNGDRFVILTEILGDTYLVVRANSELDYVGFLKDYVHPLVTPRLLHQLLDVEEDLAKLSQP